MCTKSLRCFPTLQPAILAAFMLSLAVAKSGNFSIYWNIPTFMCRRYGLSPTNITQQYGIMHNLNDDFHGDKVSILYDPGMFPAILKNKSSNAYFHRNGGVPQSGYFSQHLQIFEQHVNELIPNPGFDGIAVIDFESWRPIFRQNFGVLKPYKDLSIEIESEMHPFWSQNKLKKEATKRFERAARYFMEITLLQAKRIRPLAAWGYYGYPYCFNGRGENIEDCPGNVRQENNRLKWLFEGSDILFPSVYMQEYLAKDDRAPMVAGRVREAVRLARSFPKAIRPGVLAYHRNVYTDTHRYLSVKDTYDALHAIKGNKANGVMLWGSSNDLNSRQKCMEFFNYLREVLGPAVESLESRKDVNLVP